jgi:endonuclease YncB( thermonuclease family)
MMSLSLQPARKRIPSAALRLMTARTTRLLILTTASIHMTLAGVNSLAHTGGIDKQGCHTDTSAGARHCHPERVRAKALSTCDPQRPPRAGDEGVFHGPLVRVRDGDTLEVKVQGVVMDFRLAEVDAPESEQPYGRDARLELLNLVRDANLVLVPIDTDRYGRTVAYVWRGDLCVNRELVRRGAAWFYTRYSTSDALFHVEEEARAARRGLWASPAKDRIEPWVWRQEKQ